MVNTIKAVKDVPKAINYTRITSKADRVKLPVPVTEFLNPNGYKDKNFLIKEIRRFIRAKMTFGLVKSVHPSVTGYAIHRAELPGDLPMLKNTSDYCTILKSDNDSMYGFHCDIVVQDGEFLRGKELFESWIN